MGGGNAAYLSLQLRSVWEHPRTFVSCLLFISCLLSATEESFRKKHLSFVFSFFFFFTVTIDKVALLTVLLVYLHTSCRAWHILYIYGEYSI